MERLFKLLLVDDEDEVRERIARMVSWEACGFQLVGQAASSAEALEKMEEMLPDVVMTDVYMPFMDGLELIAEIQKQYPTTRFMILSGHDEFSYAQKALSHGVLEFLLKPASSPNIQQALLRVRQRMNDEIARHRDLSALRRTISENRAQMAVSLIQEVLHVTERDEEDLKRAAHNAGLPEMKTATLLCVQTEETRENRAIVLRDFEGDVSLVEFAMLNILQELLDPNWQVSLLPYHGRFVIICWQDADEHLSQRVAETVVSAVFKFLHITVCVGVGSPAYTYSELQVAYTQSLTALHLHSQSSAQKIFTYSDIHLEPLEKSMVCKKDTMELETLVCTGTEEQIHTFMAEKVAQLVATGTNPQAVHTLLMEYYATLLAIANNFTIDVLSFLNANSLMEMLSPYEPARALGIMEKLALLLQESMAREQADNGRLMMERARKYIHDHYSDQELSLEKICDHLHISQSYFSTLFKREFDTTFLQYLTDLRISTARDMLMHTTKKSAQIALEVGFNNANYFSYCFKRRCGISPVEFRRSGAKQE